MLEGNPAPKQWGGKPIPIYRVWSYKIEIVDRRIVNLVIYQDKIPLVALFARASNIAEDLPPTQVGDFLSAIHHITYDLTGLLTSRVYNEN
jgi:hypothetical protein